MISSAYVVSLDRFEGPMDLLLFFIKRDELDIYDIPIARITDEFLQYTRAIKQLNLEQAGEFIVMAAELMRIKAKMLLPQEERPDEEEDAEDPRAELVRRLLEYKQYKEVAGTLRDREDEFKDLAYRKYFRADERIVEEPTAEEFLSNITLFKLLDAYKKALDKAPRSKEHVVEQITYTVEEQAEYILGRIEREAQVSFFALVMERSRMFVTVTFLALLELVKSQRIRLHQEENFDDIILYET